MASSIPRLFSLPISLFCLLLLFLMQSRTRSRLNRGIVAGFLRLNVYGFVDLSHVLSLSLSLLFAPSLPDTVSISFPTESRLRSKISLTECIWLRRSLTFSFCFQSSYSFSVSVSSHRSLLIVSPTVAFVSLSLSLPTEWWLPSRLSMIAPSDQPRSLSLGV